MCTQSAVGVVGRCSSADKLMFHILLPAAGSREDVKRVRWVRAAEIEKVFGTTVSVKRKR